MNSSKFTVGLYSCAWNVIKNNFDYKDAITNWLLFADTITIAVNISTCEDDTYNALNEYIKTNKFPVKLIKTYFEKSDPFMYGKIVNSALQNIQADLFIHQDLDERLVGSKNMLFPIYNYIIENRVKALFVPTIDLYGSKEKALPEVKGKWYIHLPGLFRGAVKFGVKENGLPDYNKTSTDELIDEQGNLVPTISLLNDKSFIGLSHYVKGGLPLSQHIGFLNLQERLPRNYFWSEFWTNATGGDKNSHALTIEELANRETQKHGLPLWENKK
jgi:hypothetical protein